ncbi:hypothetical protein EVAR_16831_1 [Eumeta japonica]|uniref:Uncharacterized protein n=1 Tax=Eumeta variegata TaxID=151549 RepID=A0A4C1V2D0_EUMVA|nr:hypothetical protein EVAR_16831_1 [Eumeta japonica]
MVSQPGERGTVSQNSIGIATGSGIANREMALKVLNPGYTRLPRNPSHTVRFTSDELPKYKSFVNLPFWWLCLGVGGDVNLQNATSAMIESAADGLSTDRAV